LLPNLQPFMQAGGIGCQIARLAVGVAKGEEGFGQVRRPCLLQRQSLPQQWLRPVKRAAPVGRRAIGIQT